MSRTTATAFVAIGLLLSTAAASGTDPLPRRIPFWVGVNNAQQLDLQVATLLAEYAKTIAVRIPGDSQQQALDAVAAIRKLKDAAPHIPVLMYAWVSRDIPGTVGSKGISDWSESYGRRMAIMRGFGDVRDAEYRAKTASSILAAVERGGYDGVALDLAIRTPQYRPKPLAARCVLNASFCSDYAQGMDDSFAALRNALGKRSILYNGIWNLGPGSTEDQMRLLQHSDAVLVEFFGGDPKLSGNSFKHDILPFLDAMAVTPSEKEIFVIGRGSWQYTDYAADYALQRYLYSAYLLAAGPNSYFKYHSTFQIDTPAGRSGGVSMYSDSFADLGNPSSRYQHSDGLYFRTFTGGMVVVAPDDGDGGPFKLPQAMYSPDGAQYSGTLHLHPGEGFLLLKEKPARVEHDDLLALKLLTDWPGASLHSDAAGAFLSMQDGAPRGTHDMLVDPIREVSPRSVLQLQIRAGQKTSNLQIVAEVDDKQHVEQFAVVDVGAAVGDSSSSTPSLTFRASAIGERQRPTVGAAQLKPGQWQTMTLDGRKLFGKTSLTFKRWNYIRFNGPIDLRSVILQD